jgi:hypothetical protein
VSEDHSQSGRMLFAWTVLAVAMFAAISTFTVILIVQNGNAAERACERAVETRTDARVMWLTVFDLFPDGDHVNELRVTLNERLPPLQCVDRHVIPLVE